MQSIQEVVESAGQQHLTQFWNHLSSEEQSHLEAQIRSIDFALTDRLTETWIKNHPKPDEFSTINPMPTLPIVDPSTEEAKNAKAAGEEALSRGEVGLILVAGGQGTRLGFNGPKGSFPIGPVSGNSLFEYHAAKIHHYNKRYGCILPWYIMVGDTNEAATRKFFESKDHFALGKENIIFFKQAMMPCVGEDGKIILDQKHSLAMNPNGHGGCIPALMDEGIMADAKTRGVKSFSYFQVDNWAVKLADPYFIGYHLLNNGKMSAKIQRKVEPREAAGVYCEADGHYIVIEYTELDIYPQLMDLDADGKLIHFAANAAIHMLDVGFIEDVYDQFSKFPWHCSHKKIPYVNARGNRIVPGELNGYKFETFVFDALRFSNSKPVALEIDRLGEFTPTKQMTGAGSVEQARKDMSRYWGQWLTAAGNTRNFNGTQIEIDPRFAFTKDEYLEKASQLEIPESGDVFIDATGTISQ
jgi:UDP-N-acetylglucosamine/UDP-N-acetylgalactosamine diphosphorylase